VGWIGFGLRTIIDSLIVMVVENGK